MHNRDSCVLVTGATGFLGRRLCQRLQSEGHAVLAIGREPAAGPWDAFIRADLAADSIDPEAFAGRRVETIFHLASKAHAVAETAAAAQTYRPVIVDGTRRMLDLAEAIGVQSFIFMSTVKAMGEGNPQGEPLRALDETACRAPAGPYGQAKAEAEQLVLQSSLAHRVVLRPVMVYGPGEKGNLPRMINAVRRGRFPPLPDTGNRRSMIHVDDLLEFAIRAAQTPAANGRAYILAGKDALSTRQLYDAIRASLGLAAVDYAIPFWLLKIAAGAGSLLGALLRRRLPLDQDTLSKLTASAWYSVERAERELGYTPRHSVAEWLQSAGPVPSSAPSA